MPLLSPLELPPLFSPYADVTPPFCYAAPLFVDTPRLLLMRYDAAGFRYARCCHAAADDFRAFSRRADTIILMPFFMP